MITEKCSCELAIYFNKDPHALADFEFLNDRLFTTEGGLMVCSVMQPQTIRS